jgi:hypothetical protein
MLTACSFNATGLSASSSSAGSEGSSGTTESSTGAPTTATEPAPTSGTETSGGCMPGTVQDCSCGGGSVGTQVCGPGGVYGACDCDDPTGPAPTTETTAVDPSTTEVGPATTEVDPSTTSTTADETTTSTTADDTTTTGTDDTSTTGPMCVDPGPEPNETEGAAVAQSDKNCGNQASEFDGVLELGDVDWHRYHGNCGDDPTINFNVTAGGGLRICAFFQCDGNLNENVNCMGNTPANSPDGRPGCCATGTFNMRVGCMGGDENGTVYVRLDTPASECVDYSVSYNYG